MCHSMTDGVDNCFLHLCKYSINAITLKGNGSTENYNANEEAINVNGCTIFAGGAGNDLKYQFLELTVSSLI